MEKINKLFKEECDENRLSYRFYSFLFREQIENFVELVRNKVKGEKTYIFLCDLYTNRDRKQSIAGKYSRIDLIDYIFQSREFKRKELTYEATKTGNEHFLAYAIKLGFPVHELATFNCCNIKNFKCLEVLIRYRKISSEEIFRWHSNIKIWSSLIFWFQRIIQ